MDLEPARELIMDLELVRELVINLELNKVFERGGGGIFLESKLLKQLVFQGW